MAVLKFWDGTAYVPLSVTGGGAGVAPGGTTGQVLAKTSGADYATGWTSPPDGSLYQLRSEEGQSGGYAGLDSAGKVPFSQTHVTVSATAPTAPAVDDVWIQKP